MSLRLLSHKKPGILTKKGLPVTVEGEVIFVDFKAIITHDNISGSVPTFTLEIVECALSPTAHPFFSKVLANNLNTVSQALTDELTPSLYSLYFCSDVDVEFSPKVPLNPLDLDQQGGSCNE